VDVLLTSQPSPTPQPFCPSTCRSLPLPAVKGYAWSGGGQGIIRVDVSADGGKTWHTANLQKVPQKRGAGFAAACQQLHAPCALCWGGSNWWS